MHLDRSVLAALVVVACGGDPESGIPPDPYVSAGGGSVAQMPPDTNMPPGDGVTTGTTTETTTSADATATVTTGFAGSSSTTGAGLGGSTTTTTGVGGDTMQVGGASNGGATASMGGSGMGGAPGGAGGTVGGGGGSELPEGQCEVMRLSEEFRQSYDNLDPFYQKYADAAGVPIVSSDSPADEALSRACELVIDMTSARLDVREALIENHIRFAIIGEDELTNDIPEYSYLDDSINQRARGLGGTPAGSCAEESILCHADLDPWRGEGICVHEFAHTIASGGLFVADPTFEGRLEDAFSNAQSSGLFANTYAMENYQEYWAEGVQDWYYTNLEADPPNGIHNSVDRREELEQYDPTLYALIAELLPDEPAFVDCYSDE